MPELPEVETVVRDLRSLLIDRVLGAVRLGAHSLRRPWDDVWSTELLGRRVQSLRRRGKWIVVELDSGGRVLLHLGMTGQLTVHDDDSPLATHTHWIVPLDDGRELRFRDVRRFGSAEFHTDETALLAFFTAQQLGPEPFDLEPTQWADRLRGSSRALKAILLDQSVVAGVGNIYADESLFEARLRPTKRGDRTSRPEAERLRLAVVAVLTRAIAARGSTIRDYVGGSGLQGGFQNELRVYGRTGEPCRVCQRPIRVQRLAGRSTHSCPGCQT